VLNALGCSLLWSEDDGASEASASDQRAAAPEQALSSVGSMVFGEMDMLAA
jgi:hypothetical protein